MVQGGRQGFEMDDTEDLSDYYECVLTPNNAPSDSKTGVTFKGKDAEYLKAHKIIMNIAQNKGDRYNINDTEVNIADAPKNKPACVEIKSKFGQTGKANLKIYAKNGRGYGTIHVTKISKGEFEHVKILAFKVVRYLLDKVISGELQNEDIENMKNKAGSKPGKKVYYHCCKSCGSKFETDQDLTVHMKTDHTEKKVRCDTCENNFVTLEELEKHEQLSHKDKGKYHCNLCEYTFEKQNEVEDHKQNDHRIENSFKCKLCDHKSNGEKDYEKHRQNNHAGMCSPTSKRIRTNIETNVEEEELMEIDEPYMTRSKMKDEKVIMMQKRYDEEHEKINELKRKKSVQKEEANNKKKKVSVKKKKSKRKNKKEKSGENPLKLKLEEIPEQYDKIFKESGKDRQEFGLFSVKPNGACGANSTALHCHRDQNLGPYVMRNVNEFTVKFWPFFQHYFQFPIEVKVGSKTVTHDNEKDFLEFLRSDGNSGYMWMEHQGWQVVANMYKIKINILTLLPQETNGRPRARWTYIFPDERLSKFSTIHRGLPDMWILHVDETHYDLMVHKDSELAKEGSVEELEKEEENISNDEKERSDIGQNGPGYMGWATNDEIDNNKFDEADTKKTLVELIEGVANVKKEVANMKKEFLKKEKKQETEIKMLKEEFKKCLQELKNEAYARTKAETLAKVLQETLDAKDELKKLDQTEEMDIDVKADETEEKGGKWEKQRSERRRMKRNRDSILYCKVCGKTFSDMISFKKHQQEHSRHWCDHCNKNFQTEEDLVAHTINHQEKQVSCKENEKSVNTKSTLNSQAQEHVMFICGECKEKCASENDLNVHMMKHKEKKDNCNEGGKIFTSKKSLLEHVMNHDQRESDTCLEGKQQATSEEQVERHVESHDQQLSMIEYQCSKCDNKYGDMRKLRRHDWRAHREIECSICMEMLTSRQELKDHRQQEHKMLRKIPCKFFPECYDGDECLFEHINLINGGTIKSCPEGQNCSNQECLFTEKQHRNVNKIICKFQALCNRAGCQFTHKVQRKAFLEPGFHKKGKV